MARREKEAIFQILDYLCHNTTDTTEILVHLLANGVLTLVEMERINEIPSYYNRNKELYQVLTTKNFEIGVLLKALRYTFNNHIANSIEEQMESKNPTSHARAIQNDGEHLERIISPMIQHLCEATCNIFEFTNELYRMNILSRSQKETSMSKSSHLGRALFIYSLCMQKNVPPDILITVLNNSGNNYAAELIDKQIFMRSIVRPNSDTMKETCSSKIEVSDERIGQPVVGARKRAPQNNVSSLSSFQARDNDPFSKKGSLVSNSSTSSEERVTSSESWVHKWLRRFKERIQ